MANWMKRVVPLVTLVAASVALAAPQPSETSNPRSPAASGTVRPADPIPEEIRELRTEVDQLQRALLELRDRADHAPQYLEQGDGPITGP